MVNYGGATVEDGGATISNLDGTINVLTVTAASTAFAHTILQLISNRYSPTS